MEARIRISGETWHKRRRTSYGCNNSRIASEIFLGREDEIGPDVEKQMKPEPYLLPLSGYRRGRTDLQMGCLH